MFSIFAECTTHYYAFFIHGSVGKGQYCAQAKVFDNIWECVVGFCAIIVLCSAVSGLCTLHSAQYNFGVIATYSLPEDRSKKVIDHTCPDGGKNKGDWPVFCLNFSVVDVIILVYDACTLTRCAGPLSPSLSTTLPSMELTLLEQQELGYMPLRDDFERVRFKPRDLIEEMPPIEMQPWLCHNTGKSHTNMTWHVKQSGIINSREKVLMLNNLTTGQAGLAF